MHWFQFSKIQDCFPPLLRKARFFLLLFFALSVNYEEYLWLVETAVLCWVCYVPLGLGEYSLIREGFWFVQKCPPELLRCQFWKAVSGLLKTSLLLKQFGLTQDQSCNMWRLLSSGVFRQFLISKHGTGCYLGEFNLSHWGCANQWKWLAYTWLHINEKKKSHLSSQNAILRLFITL